MPCLCCITMHIHALLLTIEGECVKRSSAAESSLPYTIIYNLFLWRHSYDLSGLLAVEGHLSPYDNRGVQEIRRQVLPTGGLGCSGAYPVRSIFSSAVHMRIEIRSPRVTSHIHTLDSQAMRSFLTYPYLLPGCF